MARRKRSLEHAALRRQAHKDGTYDLLFKQQGGVCAICGRPPTDGRRLDIDHDHASMTIRGLLDRGCNLRLRKGLTPEWLRAAADYLERAA